jgi:serine/threonine protein kinase
MFQVLDLKNEILLLRLIPQENYEFSNLELKVSLLKDVAYKYLLSYNNCFLLSRSISICYDFFSGDLLCDYVKAQGNLLEDLVKKILKQVLKALHFLHNQGLIHGNLDSNKIIISSEGKAKVFDFGMIQTEFHEFSSPESKQGKDLDSSNDIWCLGILVVEMLTGKKHHVKDFASNIFSNEIQDFVSICTHPTPQLRPSTKDLLQHGFFSLRDSFFKHRRSEACNTNTHAELVLSPNNLASKSPQLEGSTNSKGFHDSFSILSLDDHSQLVESIDLNSSHLGSNLEILLLKIKENPEVKDSMASQLVKLKEVIELSPDDEIVLLALKIITTLSDKSHELLERICLIGLLASILPLAGEEHLRETRIEVAFLIVQMFKYEDLGKMCLAAGGLEALPKLLDADYDENKDLVLIALDCMLPLSANNDNLRVWANNGTAERLVITFSSLLKDSQSYVSKLAELIFAFARGPKAEFLCVAEVLELYLFSLKEVSDDVLLICLKTIQVLIPKFHNSLENLGCIVDFITFLRRSSEVQELTLICLIQFCELSPARYEQFCILDGVPPLLEILSNSEHLDLAIEMLAALPAVSNGARAVLRALKVMKFMVRLLVDDRIVEALSKWIKNDSLLESEVLDSEVLDVIGTRISQETQLIKWEGVFESSYNIKKNLFEVVKKKGGSQRVLDLIRQELSRS